MKYIVLLLACTIGSWSVAQESNNNSIAYVVELDDEMIEKLKQGLQLEETVPQAIRHKINIVRVRYKPSGLGETGSNSQAAPPPSNQNSTSSFPNNPSANGNRNDPTTPQNTNPNPSSGQWNPPAQFNPNPSNSTQYNPNPSNSTQYNPNPSNSTQYNANPSNAAQYNANPSSPSQTNMAQPAPSQPQNSGFLRPGGQLNGGANSSVPYIQPPQNNFQETQPGSTPTGAPQGSQYDTRNQWPNYNQFAAQDTQTGAPLLPQYNANASGYQSNSANSMLPRTFPPGNAGQASSQNLGVQLAAPGMYPSSGLNNPATMTQFNLPRQSLAVPNFHTPNIYNQAQLPTQNSGYPQDRLAANNALNGNGSAAQNVPAAFISANHPSESTRTTPLSSLEQTNRFNGVLWFMLFCSIGLNIYLSWISRGFYVRYQELADELRESFSTTV